MTATAAYRRTRLRRLVAKCGSLAAAIIRDPCGRQLFVVTDWHAVPSLQSAHSIRSQRIRVL
jgi:hypothetical protein